MYLQYQPLLRILSIKSANAFSSSSEGTQYIGYNFIKSPLRYKHYNAEENQQTER
jgi:hypothetical protein